MNARLWCLLLPFLACGQITQGTGFLENKIVDMTVRGARVVVSSPSGISWVDDIRQEPLQWKSITGVVPFSDEEQFNRDDIILNDSEMIVPVKSVRNGVQYLYYNFENQTNVLKEFVPAGINLETAELHGYKGVSLVDKFYLPLYDAGILVVQSGEPSAILIPDSNKIFPQNYVFTSQLPDSLKPIALSANDSGLTVLTESILWKFRFADSTWTKRSLPTKYSWYGLSESSGGTILSGRDTLTTIHVRDDVDFSVFSQTDFTSLRYGKSVWYGVSSEGSIEPIDAQSGEIVESINHFASRIENASGFGGAYEIRDLGYSIVGSDTIFTVATSAGFLYSTQAHVDELGKTPFAYVRRDRSLKAGLSESYAVPFIIRENINTIFEYSLSDDAHVTIDILDYNLDFVCRLVDDEPRLAGSKSSSGQSTNRSKDFWDGSRSGTGGSTVAPGVYYYRITTNRGERGFGKIIVAKN